MKRQSPLIVIVTVCALASAVVAQAQQGSPTPSGQLAQGGVSDASYVLGPADVVEVAVLQRPDFTTKARISEDGTIQLPFLGRVTAAGKSSKQLSDEVALALKRGGYFAEPIVTVNVESYASRYVTVLGDVVNPGLVSVDRAYQLSEIIARVGGIKDNAADYIIFRPKNGPERRLRVNELAIAGADGDPYVSPGDKIYSPVAEQFFISGQVKSPGSYAVKQAMTVRMALSQGGGLTDLGSDHKIKITRSGKTLTKVDLDSRVEAGDVIVVGERLF